MIGPRARQDRRRHLPRVLLHLLAQLVHRRRRRGHHVAVVVPARRQRSQQRVVDLLDQRAQAALDHPVKLEALPGGHAQRVIRIARGQVVAGQVLGRGEHAAGNPAAHHEDVFLARLAQVPVVLLIDAVELQELQVIFGEVVGLRVGQRLRDGSRQRRVPLFQELVGRRLGGGSGRCHAHACTCFRASSASAVLR